MNTLLEISNLKMSIAQKNKTIPILDGINFQIDKGQVVAIVGESGSGKSMTALSIMKLLPEPGGKIVEGNIVFNNVDLTELSEDEMCSIRGKDISMIFQEPMTSLNPVLTIGEQISEVITYHQKISQSEAIKKSIELLKNVGISRAEEIIGDYPHRLSGGMRQRVMIAIAMSCNPKLIIADEPTTALDVTIQVQILQLLRSLVKEYNTSVIIITHDLGVVSEIAEKVYVMYAGQIVEEATVEEIFDKPFHPYTIGLINSIPRITGELKRLEPIRGNVPMAGQIKQGCRFAPRCNKAFKDCFEKQPTMKRLTPTRSVRCFLYDHAEEYVE